MKVDGLRNMAQSNVRETRKNRAGREGDSFEDSFRRNLLYSETQECENTAKPAAGRVMKAGGVSRVRQPEGTAGDSVFTQVPVRYISYAESDAFRIRVEDGYTMKIKRETLQNGVESLYVELKYEDGTYAAYSAPAEEFLLPDGEIDTDKLEESALEPDTSLTGLLKDKWKKSKKMREFMEEDRKLEKMLERIRQAFDGKEDRAEELKDLVERKQEGSRENLETVVGRLFGEEDERKDGNKS